MYWNLLANGQFLYVLVFFLALSVLSLACGLLIFVLYRCSGYCVPIGCWQIFDCLIDDFSFIVSGAVSVLVFVKICLTEQICLSRLLKKRLEINSERKVVHSEKGLQGVLLRIEY